eukprot:926802_1
MSLPGKQRRVSLPDELYFAELGDTQSPSNPNPVSSRKPRATTLPRPTFSPLTADTGTHDSPVAMGDHRRNASVDYDKDRLVTNASVDLTEAKHCHEVAVVTASRFSDLAAEVRTARPVCQERVEELSSIMAELRAHTQTMSSGVTEVLQANAHVRELDGVLAKLARRKIHASFHRTLSSLASSVAPEDVSVLGDPNFGALYDFVDTESLENIKADSAAGLESVKKIDAECNRSFAELQSYFSEIQTLASLTSLGHSSTSSNTASTEIPVGRSFLSPSDSSSLEGRDSLSFGKPSESSFTTPGSSPFVGSTRSPNIPTLPILTSSSDEHKLQSHSHSHASEIHASSLEMDKSESVLSDIQSKIDSQKTYISRIDDLFSKLLSADPDDCQSVVSSAKSIGFFKVKIETLASEVHDLNDIFRDQHDRIMKLFRMVERCLPQAIAHARSLNKHRHISTNAKSLHSNRLVNYVLLLPGIGSFTCLMISCWMKLCGEENSDCFTKL